MKCPRCENAELEEHEREGVTVDACRTCRGIWLDRGELERLIAKALRDIDDVASAPRERREPERAREHEYDRERPRERERDDDDRPRRYAGWDDDDRREWRHGDRYPRRRKHWLEKLGDIFD